jgi:hypothetical protein
MNKGERAQLISRWVQPSSVSEQDRQDRAERMIREAMDLHPPFSGVPIYVYAKGSYANNTNVRLDSDVDIVVECRDCRFYDYAAGIARGPSLGVYAGRWTRDVWRQEVTTAVVNRFGTSGVDATGSIAILVKEQPGSRPSADVVPSFEYHLYRTSDRARYAEGSAVFTRQGSKVVNWPAQQLENGRRKNDATGRRYKNFVRALKNAENHLADRGVFAEKPSYLMECLVWNVPNQTLTLGDLDDAFRSTLQWLWDHLTTQYVRESWIEPNEIKYLFGDHQKWTIDDAKQVVTKTWDFLDY